MNQNRTIHPALKHSRSLRLATIGLLLATALLGTVPGDAAAAGGGWSTIFPPQGRVWNDCVVTVGIVRDNVVAKGGHYHAIGGLQISCGGYHRWMTGAVQLNFQPRVGKNAVVPGTLASVAVGATTMLHTPITETREACARDYGYWQAAATVTIAEYGTRSFYSTPSWGYIPC